MKALLMFIAFIAVLSMIAIAYGQGPAPSMINFLNSYNNPRFEAEHQQDADSAFIKSMNAQTYRYYYDSPVSKASDGFINTTTSWADIFYEVGKTSADDNILSGITFGLGKGLASSITRGVAGVADITTSAFPPYDKPLVATEYKVVAPQKEFKVNILEW
ncbi:MAG: hypothetical protein KJ880_02750 [Candidatus Omnitrophica bacterium]|nr:hypothetical protein [Candidatus Omnitrophota bacterium]MBU1869737.1 hypothetical protein [Candidatus Omnitrophota bacterium]